MSVIQNIKAAMKKVGYVVSEGEHILQDDLRHIHDFLYLHHGIGREQAGFALAYPHDTKEPLRSILLGDGTTEAAPAADDSAEEQHVILAADANTQPEPVVTPETEQTTPATEDAPKEDAAEDNKSEEDVTDKGAEEVLADTSSEGAEDKAAEDTAASTEGEDKPAADGDVKEESTGTGSSEFQV